MKKNSGSPQKLGFQKELISHLVTADPLLRVVANPNQTETTDRSTPICMVLAHEL
jgi:hypothetical protein